MFSNEFMNTDPVSFYVQLVLHAFSWMLEYYLHESRMQLWCKFQFTNTHCWVPGGMYTKPAPQFSHHTVLRSSKKVPVFKQQVDFFWNIAKTLLSSIDSRLFYPKQVFDLQEYDLWVRTTTSLNHMLGLELETWEQTHKTLQLRASLAPLPPRFHHVENRCMINPRPPAPLSCRD